VTLKKQSKHLIIAEMFLSVAFLMGEQLQALSLITLKCNFVRSITDKIEFSVCLKRNKNVAFS